MSGQHGVRYLDLGTLSIDRGGVPERVRGQRVSAILAALLMRANQPVSSDALIEAVWSDSPPDGAESTLDSHLWRLRQALEPDRQRGQPFTTVVHDGTGYRVVATVDQVDSLLFEKLTGEARDLLVTDQPARALTRCDEGLALWRGEPWTPHSDELWATASTSRMHQLRAQLRRHRVESLLQLGKADTALNDLDQLLDDEPLDEHLWSMAMLAAYRLGRVGQALETYTRARRTLIEEAGIEPGHQLRDLHTMILNRDRSLNGPTTPTDPSPARQPEIHLPVRRTELIGRESEVDALVAAVTAHQLVTVVGPAGCGKTRLVIEAAQHAASAFPDGVWFVDLTPANDHGQLLDAITSALGLAPPEVGTITDALWTFARSRRMLLVLDNCEHLLDDVADLLDLALGRRSELALLTTSREPLALDGEHVHTLTPLAVPASDDPGETAALAEFAAVRLFLQRIHYATLPFGTAPESTETGRDSADTVRLAAQICQAVDGLPLAIELAAGQANSYTLDEILTRVSTDSASLARTGRGGPRHHATLAGAIKLSVDTLAPDELTLHQALAVVPGPFTTDLAAHLCHSTIGETATGLASLVHRSLLSPLPPLRPGGPSRFSQLATIRSHGQTTLGLEERRRLEQRRDQWILDLASGMPLFGHAEEIDSFGSIDDNLSAVRASLQNRLVERPDEYGAYLASRMSGYWFYRGMIAEWERWIALAASSAAARPFDRLVVGCCHASVASLATRGSLSRRALDQVSAYPYPLSAAQMTSLTPYMLPVVLACYVTGDLDEGQQMAARIRQFADASGDPTTDLLARVGRIVSVSPTDNPTAVLAEVETVYQRARAADNHLAIWVTAIAGTIAAFAAQVPAIGLQWSNVVLDTFGRIGAYPPVASLELRGMLLLMAGQPLDAVRIIARSRALARRIGGTWPSLGTADALQAARARLAAADADQAYQQGLLDRDYTSVHPDTTSSSSSSPP